jgi:hypothetical protein
MTSVVLDLRCSFSVLRLRSLLVVSRWSFWELRVRSDEGCMSNPSATRRRMLREFTR